MGGRRRRPAQGLPQRVHAGQRQVRSRRPQNGARQVRRMDELRRRRLRRRRRPRRLRHQRRLPPAPSSSALPRRRLRLRPPLRLGHLQPLSAAQRHERGQGGRPRLLRRRGPQHQGQAQPPHATGVAQPLEHPPHLAAPHRAGRLRPGLRRHLLRHGERQRPGPLLARLPHRKGRGAAGRVLPERRAHAQGRREGRIRGHHRRGRSPRHTGRRLLGPRPVRSLLRRQAPGASESSPGTTRTARGSPSATSTATATSTSSARTAAASCSTRPAG